MKSATKKKGLVLVLITMAAILAVVVIAATQKRSDSQDSERQSDSLGSQAQATKQKAGKQHPSIASNWQWQENEPSRIPAMSKQTKELPFTPESVYDALQAVRLDEDGNIVLDHDTLLSLDETLERIYRKLDSGSFAALKDLIQTRLPGKTGEQTAQLVEDYYEFLEAKDTFSETDAATHDPSTEGTAIALQKDRALYAELKNLREVHLGKETADALFRVSDANAQYMFDSMALEYDDTLSPEALEAKRAAIEAEYIARAVNIQDWPSRYAAFSAAKNTIVAASISAEQKQTQLNALLEQHFNDEERDRIQHLALDQP